MKAVCPNCQASITISAGPAATKPTPASTSSSAAPAIHPAPVSTNATPPNATTPRSSAAVAIAPATPLHPAPASEARPAVAPVAAPANVANSLPERQPFQEDSVESKADAPSVGTSTITAPASKRPLVLAAVILLLAAGVAVAVWRPWEHSAARDTAAVPTNEERTIPSSSSVLLMEQSAAPTTLENLGTERAQLIEPELSEQTPPAISPEPDVKPPIVPVPMPTVSATVPSLAVTASRAVPPVASPSKPRANP